jgi:hypothetical protein
MSLLAAAPVQVVVLDARTAGSVAPQTGALIAEEVARSLPPSAFKVTTSAQLAAVLGLERQRQLLGCSGDGSSCAAELASALGADVVVQSTLSAVDGGLRCDVAFISGRDGSTLERATVDGPSDSALLQRLHEELGSAAATLFGRERPGSRLEPGSRGWRRWAWIPALAGGALLASGGALFGVTSSTWSSLTTRELTPGEARELAAQGRSQQTWAWALTGAGAAALIAAAGLFVLGAPVEPRVTLAPVASGGGAGLLFSGVLP